MCHLFAYYSSDILKTPTTLGIVYSSVNPSNCPTEAVFVLFFQLSSKTVFVIFNNNFFNFRTNNQGQIIEYYKLNCPSLQSGTDLKTIELKHQNYCLFLSSLS